MAQQQMKSTSVEIFETAANGHALTTIPQTIAQPDDSRISIDPEIQYQTILGFGGSFTDASSFVLSNLSKEKSDAIIKAYFSKDGANYTLTRTHINSCDFSLGQYSYATVKGDTALKHFSIEKDRKDLFPIIKTAQAYSPEGFRIIASPWTAPPWMKDNNDWVGGKLLPQYKQTWALYYAKYIKACKEQGIPIWGITVINEPHGNGNNWESMLFTPKEMTDFVQYELGPTLKREGLEQVNILGYDQNRAGLPEWVDTMFNNEATSEYFAGTAIHWYESTYEFFPKELQYAYRKAPNKYLIQTEACIDAEIPHWKDDAWYWSENATDWGWDWAPEDQKYLHPKYIPAHRYARDIIGCLQNRVQGWIDWNMVLNKQGGPNWFKNWCIAPVIADTELDEVYFTPLYYIMCHFSKFIRPEAIIIESKCSDNEIMVTSAINPDKSVAVVIFNPTTHKKTLSITLYNQQYHSEISAQGLQTMFITNK